MAKKKGKLEDVSDYPDQFVDDEAADEFEEMLYSRHVEIQTFEDLEKQRGTPIPALFHQFYKFIQNPSTVSVDTFKRMVDTDDTIGSGVDFLTTCLAARIGGYQHPSEEVTSWINDTLDDVEGGFHNVIKELLSASWAGFTVAEKVWANTDQGFVPRKIVSLPPTTLLFETERTGELTPDGILQYQRNYNPFLLGRGLNFFGGIPSMGIGNGTGRPDLAAKLGDLPFPLRSANTFNYLSVRIPRQKCIHYAFDAQGKFGNPYGRSLLRRAYKYYVMKDAFLQMMSIALDRKGTALTVVYADPNTTLQSADSLEAGQDVRNVQGKGVRADVAARDAFKNIHNDSVIILPGKKDEIYGVDFMPQSPNTGDFISALDFCNKSILRALLVPTLIFGNGDGTGSYSLGQEHAKTFDKILDSINAGLCQVLLQQLIAEMIRYNFPRSAWEKDGLGSFGKRKLTQDELEKEMTVFKDGIDSGIIDQGDLKDLNKMRETIGFEPRKTPIEKPAPMDIFGGGGGQEGADNGPPKKKEESDVQ